MLGEPWDDGRSAAAPGLSILLGLGVIALAWLRFVIGSERSVADALLLAGGFIR